MTLRAEKRATAGRRSAAARRSVMTRNSASERLDQWLVGHGLVSTRSAAASAIMAGTVLMDGVVVDKPGHRVHAGARVEVRAPEQPYASRGGVKLAHALAAFGIDVRGRTAVDLGASTGGFTDCLLQAGAARVYAVDVGRGQLAWRLRHDPRVVSLEGRNARSLTPADVGGPRDLVTVDLAFISLRLVWPAIAGLLAPGGDVVALVKPQFEAGRREVRRGGVVRNPAVHEAVLHDARDGARAAGLVPLAITFSPITGPAGNIEYVIHARRGALTGPSAPDAPSADRAAAPAGHDLDVAAVVAEAHRTLGRRPS